MLKSTSNSIHNNVCSEVVANNLCIGCGICAGVCPRSNLKIEFNKYGEYNAFEWEGKCSEKCKLCVEVCPFADNDHNEDTIGRSLYGEVPRIQHTPETGYYLGAYVGAVCDENARLASASGGMTTLLLKSLLNKGHVDAVVVPQPIRGRPWFEMGIVDNAEDIDRSRGSVYHILEWSRVLREMISGPERTYAVVGVPCVIKGLRLAQQILPQLKRRLRFALGLTCGGYKSLLFPDALSLVYGVDPQSIRYRDKKKARHASAFRLVMWDGETERDSPWSSLYGFLYENGYAVPKACLFCDDVFAECADVTLMDAWLPEFSDDRRGTSLLVVRNEDLGSVLRSLADEGQCSYKLIAPELVIRSQRGVVRKKRDGLSARIRVASESGYCPKKRTELLPNADGDAISSARSELAAWREGRSLAGDFVGRYRGRRGIGSRILAWLHVLMYARLLRRHNIHVYKMRALWGLGRIPSPRLLLRSAKTQRNKETS